MCGILGILAFNEMLEKKQEKLRQEAMIFLSSELLQLTQSRGKDATGISTMFANCDYMGLKMGITPTDFVARFGGTEKDFDGYLNIWRKKSVPAKMVIGHCRKSSVGNPEDNMNNHPIKVEDVIGVHNGTLTNHNRIFELLKCGRDGTVDSEAIFRLLHHFTNNGKEPFAPEIIQEVCKRLHGTYACLAFTGNNPYQMVGFRDSRPMEALLIKPLKLLLVASDKDFLKHVIFRYNKIANLYHFGATKFPPLKKTDVEIASLPDDHLYIFDIRKEVKDVSKITDLFISEKIPRNDKIWDSSFTGHQSGFTSQSGLYNKVTKTQNANYLNKATTKEEKKDKDRLGMAWNKETKLYQDVTNLGVSGEYSSVEINSDNGEIIDAETKDVLIEGKKEVNKDTIHTPDTHPTIQTFGFDRVYTNIDNVVVEKATIKELPVPVENTSVVVVEPVETIINKTEVILETNPDASEKAEIALQKEKKFDTVEELQLALEVEKPEDLRRLSLCSFANRVRRFFYKKGWYDGYVICLHELEKAKDKNSLTPRNLLIRANNKRKAAEQGIRTLKSIVRIFNHITTEYGVADSNGIGDISINKAVVASITNNNELDANLIKTIFKPGDFKTAPILEKITSSVTSNKKTKG